MCLLECCSLGGFVDYVSGSTESGGSPRRLMFLFFGLSKSENEVHWVVYSSATGFDMLIYPFTL